MKKRRIFTMMMNKDLNMTTQNRPRIGSSISRRTFVTGATAGSALLGLGLPLAGRNAQAETPILRGTEFDLDIGYLDVNFTGSNRVATAVNETVPAPVLRWREGEQVTLRVTNHLPHDTSIHWHGIILPAGMDGVPGISFDGIQPGETFTYRFDVNQSGTYWYHSHSDFQEQTGLYGAIIVDPAGSDPVAYDREHVVLLSDWTDEDPAGIYANLKKQSDYYNFRERTAGDLVKDIQRKGLAQTAKDREMWNVMRMSDRDLSDVTAYTYTYLMNGATPDDNWLGMFSKGEKVRLRIINGAAMTIFDLRIPGLKMTVVAADGQNVQPVTVDEFRIGVAEVYDVIIEPDADRAYTIFAQNIDRSGFARGTLTPDTLLRAEVPPMDPPALLGHQDMGMGMDHSGHDMGAMQPSAGDAAATPAMDHSGHDMSSMQAPATEAVMPGMDHSGHDMAAGAESSTLGLAGFGSKAPPVHQGSEFGPQVDMRAESPADGLSDPGIGLRNHAEFYGRRVLNYGDLRNLETTADRREPSREIELHLTGNMSRYMWSINGVKFMDAEPLRLQFGERVRITLINDTMMTHPIHLHGMWSELETGDPAHIPRKHTVIVQPGSRISYLITADAKGGWAYHCHLLYHMPGMFREVVVS